MEWRPAASSHHWAASLCIRNFIEHALRRVATLLGSVVLVGAIFFAGFPNAFRTHGHRILPSPFLFNCTHSRPALVWTTQHGQRRLLRDSRRTRRRLSPFSPSDAITRRVPTEKRISKPLPPLCQNLDARFSRRAYDGGRFLALVLSGAMSFRNSVC